MAKKTNDSVILKSTQVKLGGATPSKKNIKVDPVDTEIEKFLSLNEKLDEFSKFFLRVTLKNILKLDINNRNFSRVLDEVKQPILALENYISIKYNDEHPRTYELECSGSECNAIGDSSPE